MSHRQKNNDKNNLWFQHSAFPYAKTAILAVAAMLACAAAPASAAEEDGPYGEVTAADLTAQGHNDAGFSSLFSSWKKMDNVAQTSVYIPSGRPVAKLSLTSNYGVRSDPFNGSSRMHKGIDIPGPVGTPVYATADGVVSRAGWASGYGNLIEISHGNDMETRYGHMSKLIVAPNTRVHRGQLIGLMGSTGRSTGSHLHYEVRIAGNAINPLPFVAGADYLVALNTKPPVAMGGPTPSQERAAD